MATKTIYFYREGQWHGWNYRYENLAELERTARSYGDSFQYLRSFTGEDAEKQAVAYARAHGLPLQPAIDPSAYE